MAVEAAISKKIRVIPRRAKQATPSLLATLIALMASTCDVGANNVQDSSNVCEREMIRAANRNAVPLAVLYAVALTETGQKGSLHAYAMNIEGHPVFSLTLREAIARFAESKRAGAVLIDIGCMQINHHFHGANFVSLEDMFDPARNVDYAAKFLRNLRAGEGSWTAAVARYHAGPNNPPAQKSYVCAVISNMIASGFGSWTQASKTFCNP